MGTFSCIAIIPARGGSKGLQRKNILQLAGKPLIAHTIGEALLSKYLSGVIVSSEDEEILSVARDCGAETSLRPFEIAQDKTPTLPVLINVLEQHFMNDLPDKVVTLQPTSPLRTADQIDHAIEMLDQNYDSCISICEVEHSPYKMFHLKNNILTPVIDGSKQGIPRQLLPVAYRENGAIYVTWTSVLLEQKSIWGRKSRPFIMDAESSVDIDTDLDIRLAEIIIRKRAS